MRKTLTIFIILAILLLIVGFSYFFVCKKGEKPASPSQGEESTAEEFIPMTDLSNNPEKSPAATNGARKIAMVIAFKDFRDEEYFTPRGIFDDAEAEVEVISDELGTAQGADGGDVKVDIKLSELNVADFDAIVFIGGPGVPDHLYSEEAYRIVQEAVVQNKVLAAICISPAVLAKAGVLRKKKATIWTSIANREPRKVLEENGAIYQDRSVVQDGNIITAIGPSVAKEFATKIIESL